MWWLISTFRDVAENLRVLSMISSYNSILWVSDDTNSMLLQVGMYSREGEASGTMVCVGSTLDLPRSFLIYSSISLFPFRLNVPNGDFNI